MNLLSNFKQISRGATVLEIIKLLKRNEQWQLGSDIYNKYQLSWRAMGGQHTPISAVNAQHVASIAQPERRATQGEAGETLRK